ncbi:alpha/beta hydrolase [Candidatus Roizmanbacteria bacterium]|nr:alpha/beta hydrolase [Candidatus Roizmanbacteria bacterium]
MEEKIITTAIGNLHFQIEKGKDKAMVFLHGGGGSSSAWNLMQPYLNKIKNTKIYIDLRGHGESLRPDTWQEYSLEKHTEDILALINKLKLKSCIIIGHCLGSMVAATFATRYPERVEKLILINPGINRGTVLFNRFTKYIYTAIYRCIEFLNIKSITPPQDRVDYTKFKKTHDLSLQRLLTDLRHMGLRTALSQSVAFFHWDYERVYKAIKTPTFIIGGKYDTIFNCSTTERIKYYIPGAKLTIINTNHISIMTSPKEVMQQIESFFR